MFFLALLLLCFRVGYGQSVVLSGKVVGSRGGDVVYGSVGLISENVSTVTDNSGAFSLRIDRRFMADSIQFSSMGFRDRCYALKDIDFRVPLRVIMEELPYELPVIYVFKGKSSKKMIRNGVPYEGMSLYAQTSKEDFPNDVLGKEFLFFVKRQSGIYSLDRFSVDIIENSFSFIRFRLNVYKSEGGRPGAKISESAGYMDIDNRVVGWNSCKVGAYIESDVFLGLEVVEVRGASTNHRLSFGSTFSRDAYYYRSSSNKNFQNFASALKVSDRALKNGKIAYRGYITVYK